jgi:hypothetical protein
MGVPVMNLYAQKLRNGRCERREGRSGEPKTVNQERPLAKHREWIQFRDKMMLALGPFPEARKALEQALRPETPRTHRDCR